jgi:hypothetical protein
MRRSPEYKHMKRVEFLGMLLSLAVLHSGFAGAAGSETGPVPAPTEASDGSATGSDARPVTESAGAPIAVEVRRNVVINGQRPSDSELASVERTYRIHIADANYWYDLSTGAWGAQGGPTLGFIAPGLTLGGTLQPDASGGGTGVFVNGRELHPYDLAQLQQMTGPIAPGRYFITAQGLAGYEGGEPAYDLNALATLGQSGSSGSWKKRLTLASGLSGGGIVSTGN